MKMAMTNSSSEDPDTTLITYESAMARTAPKRKAVAMPSMMTLFLPSCTKKKYRTMPMADLLDMVVVIQINPLLGGNLIKSFELTNVLFGLNLYTLIFFGYEFISIVFHVSAMFNEYLDISFIVSAIGIVLYFFFVQEVEMGGSGIFRPEVTEPIGLKHPVIAWGLGLERLAMMYYKLDDIRKIYQSDIDWLRNFKR